MRTKIKELKRIARGNLQRHFLTFMRVMIFCGLITSLLEMPFSLMTNETLFSTSNIIYYVATTLIGIASVVLTAGQYRLHLRLARTGEIHLSEVFMPLRFHSNQFILTEFLLFGISIITLIPTFGGIYLIYTSPNEKNYLFALLGLIITLVLKIYISINFDLVYYAMIDDEELSLLQALTYTKKMIRTHKRRYLYMQISFFGIILLGILSFGIGLLWIEPYMIQTVTVFYLDVKGELPEVLENRKKNGPTPEPAVFDSYA